ncbi:MAG: beta-glucosidase, partial [Alphaproteobacteria bacterium]|nr:beta-glucosidase [Alphaproteobacteria bacterium]
QEQLIESLCAAGTPVIVLVHAGSAVTMQRWIDRVAAVVQVWYPGEEGGAAVADVLFGDHNPAGCLPVTFPQHAGQCPLYYNPKPTGRSYDYENLSGRPLFPFGHGLSYSSFQYTNLQISPGCIDPTDSATVSLDVENTGERDGGHVVQLYVRDRVGSTARPVRELKDFQRLFLAAGERTTVRFVLGPDQLQMLDRSMQWVVEPGEFDVMAGASSADIRLAGRLRVE